MKVQAKQIKFSRVVVTPHKRNDNIVDVELTLSPWGVSVENTDGSRILYPWAAIDFISYSADQDLTPQAPKGK